MGAPDQQLLDANWHRMRTAIERAATEYERIAAELRGITFGSRTGGNRSPDAIISQAALTADPGRVHADLMHRLATWAETINELHRHGISSRILCPYTIDDPERSCVLTAGHDLPTDAGMLVHMSADGVMFR
jgi:hypothetical protein